MKKGEAIEEALRWFKIAEKLRIYTFMNKNLLEVLKKRAEKPNLSLSERIVDRVIENQETMIEAPAQLRDTGLETIKDKGTESFKSPLVRNNNYSRGVGERVRRRKRINEFSKKNEGDTFEKAELKKKFGYKHTTYFPHTQLTKVTEPTEQDHVVRVTGEQI